jgi:ABC-type lipopolysaccharide export system ATPase subunit
MSCLYDIAMIIFNATSGYVALGKKNIQRLIGVYNDRSEVLSKYINQAPPISRAFKLLEALDAVQQNKQKQAETLKETKSAVE